MTFLGEGETPLQGLARESAVVSQQTIADVLLHPVIAEATPATLDEIPNLLEAGHNSIKFFMSFPGFDGQVQGYLEAVRRAGSASLITLIHCEDYPRADPSSPRLLRPNERLPSQRQPVLRSISCTSLRSEHSLCVPRPRPGAYRYMLKRVRSTST
jgi:dihydroorotase-like cyclic amidohydrolase